LHRERDYAIIGGEGNYQHPATNIELFALQYDYEPSSDRFDLRHLRQIEESKSSNAEIITPYGKKTY